MDQDPPEEIHEEEEEEEEEDEEEYEEAEAIAEDEPPPADQAEPEPEAEAEAEAEAVAMAQQAPQQLQIDAQALGNAIGQAIGVAQPLPGAGVGAGGGERGVRKVPLFQEPHSAAAWLPWKRRFEVIAGIGNWGDERRKQELLAAMGDEASLIVADITLAGKTFEQLLQAYEERFISDTASDAARAEFALCVQGAEEPLNAFHARLRELFLRAYPGAAVDAAAGVAGAAQATATMIRDRFNNGVQNAAIREFLFDQRPDTYQRCLEVAMWKEATLQRMGQAPPKNSSKGKGDSRPANAAGGVHGMGGAANQANTNGGEANARCNFCQKEGHFMRNCRLLDRAREIVEGTNTRGGGRGGRRGRGRGRGGGRGEEQGERDRGEQGQKGNKKLWGRNAKLAQMEDAEEEEEAPKNREAHNSNKTDKSEN